MLVYSFFILTFRALYKNELKEIGCKKEKLVKKKKALVTIRDEVERVFEERKEIELMVRFYSL